MSLYELQAPTVWAPPPDRWSTSLLDNLEACPRRWQLLNSAWGEFARFPVRRHPKAIEGDIIHKALDALARACCLQGNPPFGDARFTQALLDARFFSIFSEGIGEWQHRLAGHPRGGPPFRLRTTADELADRAVRLFREQYQSGERAGDSNALRSPVPARTRRTVPVAKPRSPRFFSEIEVKHPRLPFSGTIDLVKRSADGVEIVDYKTGIPKEQHRQQLLRYALLWWRSKGEVPTRVSAQYLHGSDSWEVSSADLEKTEREIERAIPRLLKSLSAHPAEARPGEACTQCAVRARCDAGWHLSEEAAHTQGRGDVEVIVAESVNEHGFKAVSRKKTALAVVYDSAVGRLLPPCKKGQRLRILDGEWQLDQKELEIKAWTEVFEV